MIIFVLFFSREPKALKMMENSEMSENELQIAMRLDHLNIIKYLDNFQLINRHEKITLCMVTEYCQVRICLFIF